MKADRDIEKIYPLPEFVAKLRRLADALEAAEPFEIQIAGERVYVPKRAVVSIEHEREDGHEELEFQVSWEHAGAAMGEDAEEDEEDEEAEDEEVSEADERVEAEEKVDAEAEVKPEAVPAPAAEVAPEKGAA